MEEMAVSADNQENQEETKAFYDFIEKVSIALSGISQAFECAVPVCCMLKYLLILAKEWTGNAGKSTK